MSQNSLEVAQKEREAAEKQKLYTERIAMEQAEAVQEFKRAKGEIDQQKADVKVQHDIAMKEKKEAHSRTWADLGLKLTLQTDQNSIKESEERQRLVKEENASREKRI